MRAFAVIYFYEASEEVMCVHSEEVAAMRCAAMRAWERTNDGRRGGVGTVKPDALGHHNVNQRSWFRVEAFEVRETVWPCQEAQR